ncbi:hypothetical protein B4071_0891 [Bacillus subtilis]|nr:hypothetical protein B4069_1088 [Bacillus subtilis]GAK79774.1 hypothetical protein BSMD_016820 [Bacillus subtilis Miyagi-4]KIN29777.1 hypothetical protein B4068_1076 [Bacillus subtilis]KIN39170.1 hypothetical protein B4071_0891 [Bacillus subtilis]KIN44890.1 hypothetical protein B4072_1101 [Bacillus subtilis]
MYGGTSQYVVEGKNSSRSVPVEQFSRFFLAAFQVKPRLDDK